LGAPFVHGANGLGDIDMGEPKNGYLTDKTVIIIILNFT
jgi:hypothetical protein